MKNKHIEASNEKDTKSTTETKKRRKFKLIKMALLLAVRWQAFGVVHLQNPSHAPCQQKIVTRFRILLVGLHFSLLNMLFLFRF